MEGWIEERGKRRAPTIPATPGESCPSISMTIHYLNKVFLSWKAWRGLMTPGGG
jgi:hypothetical protein